MMAPGRSGLMIDKRTSFLIMQAQYVANILSKKLGISVFFSRLAISSALGTVRRKSFL